MFYKYVNNHNYISYRSMIGALIAENDTVVMSGSDKAIRLNKSVQSNFENRAASLRK